MSLNVDFKNCPNAFEECPPDFKLAGGLSFDMLKRDDDGKVTHHLTYECQSVLVLMMGIGMGKITESTVEEFIERSEIWQDVIGAAGPGNYPKYQIDRRTLTPAARATAVSSARKLSPADFIEPVNDIGMKGGFFTIRLFDGSANGDTESCIGIIFEEKDADLLVSDAIDYVRITPDDIRNLIGLSSNVTKEPWTTFWKKLRRAVQDRLHRQAEAKKRHRQHKRN